MSYNRQMTQTDYICLEKNKEEDSSALTIAPMHQYDDLKTTFKKAEKTNYSDQKHHWQYKDQQNNNS